MKKVYSTILMLTITIGVLNLCSCGGNDDGGGVSYTESEIVELLTGTWGVSGELKYTEGDKRMEGTYTGSLEFRSNLHYYPSLNCNCTRNDFHSEGQNDNNEMKNIIYRSIPAYPVYSILKKDGKIYIVFSNYSFEIVSLTKNTFKFVLDQDIEYNGKIYSHVYMTVVSK